MRPFAVAWISLLAVLPGPSARALEVVKTRRLSGGRTFEVRKTISGRSVEKTRILSDKDGKFLRFDSVSKGGGLDMRSRTDYRPNGTQHTVEESLGQKVESTSWTALGNRFNSKRITDADGTVSWERSSGTTDWLTGTGGRNSGLTRLSGSRDAKGSAPRYEVTGADNLSRALIQGKDLALTRKGPVQLDLTGIDKSITIEPGDSYRVARDKLDQARR
jgi:hypothetical protein